MELKKGASFSCIRSFNQSDFDRFAALSGDDNPIHVDPEFSRRTKFGRTVAHGMLLYASISSCLNTYLPETYQTTQELIFPNPTYAGVPVKFRSTVVEVNDIHGSVVVETLITRADGQITCQALTQLARLPYKASTNLDVPAIVPSEVQAWKGLSLGQKAEIQRTFNVQNLDEYCHLVQEASLLHRDSAYAGEVGFKDTPVPGALLGGLFSYLLGTRLPGRGTNWLKQKLFYLEPVYPQEEINASVEIVRLRPEKDLVNLQTEIRNTLGALVCKGEALVLVKDLEI
jgi:acyl dehydratase